MSILTSFTLQAVIEIVPYAFDKVFYSNYIPALGFAHYIISTGHLTPSQRNTGGDRCVFKSANTFDELSCKKIPHAYPGIPFLLVMFLKLKVGMKFL